MTFKLYIILIKVFSKNGNVVVCCGGKWTYQGFGSEVVSSFRVDVDKGKWSWFCCPGDTKEYVIRDSDGYGDVDNLDILLDQIDKILTVITFVLFLQ